jgi:hypothetical protein
MKHLANFIGDAAAHAVEQYVDARYGNENAGNVVDTLNGWVVRNTWLEVWQATLQRGISSVLVQYYDLPLETGVVVWTEKEGWV